MLLIKKLDSEISKVENSIHAIKHPHAHRSWESAIER